MSDKTRSGKQCSSNRIQRHHRRLFWGLLICSAILGWWSLRSTDPLDFPGLVQIDEFGPGIIFGNIGELENHGLFAVLNHSRKNTIVFRDRIPVEVSWSNDSDFGSSHHTFELDKQRFAHLDFGKLTVVDRLGRHARVRLELPASLDTGLYFALDAVVDGEQIHILLGNGAALGDAILTSAAVVSYMLPTELSSENDYITCAASSVVPIPGGATQGLFRNSTGTKWAVIQPTRGSGDPEFTSALVKLETGRQIPIPSAYCESTLAWCSENTILLSVGLDGVDLLMVNPETPADGFQSIAFDLPDRVKRTNFYITTGHDRWVVARHERRRLSSFWMWNYSVLLEELFLIDRATGRVHASHSIHHSEFANSVSPYYQQIVFSDDRTHLLVATGDHTVLTIDIAEWIQSCGGAVDE